MAGDALMLAVSYMQRERELKQQLSPCGACLSAEVIADALEGLSWWRSVVVSALMDASKTATEEEKAQIIAALKLICGGFKNEK